MTLPHKAARRNALVLVVMLALLVAACGSNSDNDSASGLTDVTFRLDWVVVGQHAPFYAALEQGFFEDEGLSVEILEGFGSGLAATLVGNGTDDFGFSDAGVVALSLEQGVPIKMVMGVLQRNPSVILSLASSGIESPADLAGKTVGASPGEAPLTLLPAYLNANGVDEGDVDIVNMDPSAKVTALLEQKVDAIVGYATAELPVARANAEEEINVQLYADYGITALSNGIITSDSMLEENPDVVAKFVRAVEKGIAWTLENQEEAVDILVNRFPQTVVKEDAVITLQETLDSLHTSRTEGEPIGFMAPEDWQETLDLYTELGLLKEEISPEDVYTNEYVSE